MKSPKQIMLVAVALLFAAPALVVAIGLPLGLLSIGLDQLPLWVKPVAAVVVAFLGLRSIFGLSILPRFGKR